MTSEERAGEATPYDIQKYILVVQERGILEAELSRMQEVLQHIHKNPQEDRIVQQQDVALATKLFRALLTLRDHNKNMEGTINF